MEPGDRVRMRGNVHVRLWDGEGNLKEERKVSNLVLIDGREHTADQLSKAPAQPPMGWMAIGSDPAPPAVLETDTDLMGANGEKARVALDGVYPIATATQVAYRTTFLPGVGTDPTISEAIIVNNALAGPASGVAMARTVFTAVNKTIADTLTIDWTITLAGP